MVIYTTRCKADLPGRADGWTAAKAKAYVEDWLLRNNFTFAEVYIGQGKPIAAAYLDDRAVMIRTNPECGDFVSAITAIKKLLN